MPFPNRREFLYPVLLTVATAALFGGCFEYYFQGDSLHWLAHRYTSLGQVAEAFVSVDSYGYFRPLSHPLIPSLFFAFFGLQPWGYHWVVFLLYLATVWILYAFLRTLMDSDWEAFAGSFFFGVHSVNAFVTFDFSFGPELLYGLWYLLSALCFLMGLRTGRRLWVILSVLFFLLSLMSKEAAVTLPANLFLLAFFTRKPQPDSSSRKLRTSRANPLGAVAPHLSLLAGYLLYLVFVVRGGDVLLGGANSLAQGIGPLAVTALSNLWLALRWGGNLPAGWASSWRDLPSVLEWFLWSFALLPVAGLFASVFRPTPAKRLIQLGFLWFVVALTPMLTLSDFKSYYLYVPLIGLSVAVGQSFGLARRAVPSRWRLPTNLAAGLVLLLLGVSCRRIVKTDLENHRLLGGGALASKRLATGIKDIRPNLPAAATILIRDTAERPLYWPCAHGELFRLLYRDPSIRTLFASLGQFPTPEELAGPGFLALAYRNGRLEDETERARRDPALFTAPQVTYATTVQNLIQVHPKVVSRGEGRYTLLVVGAEGRVEIQFRVDGGRVGVFRTRLDSRGTVGFFVSKENPPGTYEFLAVRPGGGEWTRSEPAAVLVVK